MKVISFMNVKGGVGKTTSTVNFAYILANTYGKKVLVVDLDKQANASMTFGIVETERTVSDVLVDLKVNVRECIYSTNYNVDVIPSNMALLSTDKKILLDENIIQHTRLAEQLKKVKDDYDYCLVDCPTALNISSLNALVASDDVVIPMKIDKYAFVGLTDILEVVEEMQAFNANLKVAGCFLTMYRNTNIVNEGLEFLIGQSEQYGLKLFKTFIRDTIKVSESTFSGPLIKYDKNCTASIDYFKLVDEYLGGENG